MGAREGVFVLIVIAVVGLGFHWRNVGWPATTDDVGKKHLLDVMERLKKSKDNEANAELMKLSHTDEPPHRACDALPRDNILSRRPLLRCLQESLKVGCEVVKRNNDPLSRFMNCRFRGSLGSVCV